MNRGNISLLRASFVLVILMGCRELEPDAPAPVNTFQYLAYDLNGTLVATGKLSLSFQGTAITGRRDIKGDGTEAGAGNITGQMESDGTVRIELNPESVPVIILRGKSKGNAITGDRLYDTGTPPFARIVGTFTATLGTR